MNLEFPTLKIYREHCSFGESLHSLFVHPMRSSRQQSSVAGEGCLVPWNHSTGMCFSRAAMSGDGSCVHWSWKGMKTKGVKTSQRGRAKVTRHEVSAHRHSLIQISAVSSVSLLVLCLTLHGVCTYTINALCKPTLLSKAWYPTSVLTCITCFLSVRLLHGNSKTPRWLF